MGLALKYAKRLSSEVFKCLEDAREKFRCKLCQRLLKFPYKAPDMCDRYRPDVKRKVYKIDPMMTILARNGIRCPGPSRKERCKKIKYLPRLEQKYKPVHYLGPKDEHFKHPWDKTSSIKIDRYFK